MSAGEISLIVHLPAKQTQQPTEQPENSSSKMMHSKKKRESDHTMMMISCSILAITAQVGGAMLSGAYTRSGSYKTWALGFVEAATVAGFGLTLAGIGVRRIKPVPSTVMIKLGAIATASAIIVSLTIPLSSVVAWIVGPAAAAIVAISVALA